MKIRTIILTLVAILLVLGLIALCFPKEGLNFLGLKLKFPTLKEALFKQNLQYANIDDLVDEKDETRNADNVAKVKIADKYISGLEYPDDDTTALYSFFNALEQAGNKKVRILHYGDSQIEGDRITSYLRSRLQSEFQGKGQGQIPLFSLSNIKGVSYNASSNWLHKSIINKRDKRFNCYGLMMTACVSYVQEMVDTTTFDTTYLRTAWISMKFDNAISNDLHLYCSSPNNQSTITISSKENVLVQKNLQASNDIIDLKIPINTPISSLKIVASSGVQLYSLDNSLDEGVYVDNISLRGSSGWGMNWNNKHIISTMAEMLDVKLIIMQFGVNAVPQEEDKVLDSYDFFEKEYSRQLAFLRESIPQAQIIVVGVSDRSRKKGDGYETNPNIPKLIKAQRQAAKENGCLFWDMYEAMGGNNSMPSWVLREKPLANPDFIHFNERGAKYIAEMFYKSFELEYKKYQMSKQR